jgi:hypothetical protein
VADRAPKRRTEKKEILKEKKQNKREDLHRFILFFLPLNPPIRAIAPPPAGGDGAATA